MNNEQFNFLVNMIDELARSTREDLTEMRDEMEQIKVSLESLACEL